jgi:hypothetical protein
MGCKRIDFYSYVNFQTTDQEYSYDDGSEREFEVIPISMISRVAKRTSTNGIRLIRRTNEKEPEWPGFTFTLSRNRESGCAAFG